MFLMVSSKDNDVVYVNQHEIPEKSLNILFMKVLKVKGVLVMPNS